MAKLFEGFEIKNILVFVGALELFWLWNACLQNKIESSQVRAFCGSLRDLAKSRVTRKIH